MAPPTLEHFAPIESDAGEYGSFASVEDELVDVPTLRAVASDDEHDSTSSGREWSFSWLSRRFPLIISASVCTVLVLTVTARHTTFDSNITINSGNDVKSDNPINIIDPVVDISTPVIEPVADVTVDSTPDITVDAIADTAEPTTDASENQVADEAVVINYGLSNFDYNGDLPGVDFTLTRKGYAELPYFKPDNNIVKSYKFLEDYQALVEPYVDMKLTIYEQPEDMTSYQYRLCDTTTGETCYSGSYELSSPDDQQTVNIPCKSFDVFNMEVVGYNSNKEAVAHSSGKAVCMYVRRELRTLSDDDLQTAIDAMYAMWSTSDDVGQQTYGSKFHSSTFFSIAHDFNAGQRDADHIHQGLGFVPQHIKLVNMFEASMQAVNPRVSLPYWDFTLDVAQGLTIYESPMFTEKTFGSITPPIDQLKGFVYEADPLQKTAIQNGRWALLKSEQYQLLTSPRFGPQTPVNDTLEIVATAKLMKSSGKKIMRDSLLDSTTTTTSTAGPTTTSSTVSDMTGNAFGYMRGPWNMNPSPYISRFTLHNVPSLPSCDNYNTGIVNEDYLDFLKWAPYGPHAATHAVIGGVYGCDKMNFLVEEGLVESYDVQIKVCAFWGVVMKELYRQQYIDPKTDCYSDSLQEHGIHCGYVCESSKYNFMYEALKPLLIRFLAEGQANLEHTWTTLRDFICEGDAYKVFVGDHLESASTSDPSFWPIHPTLERLVKIKYMTGHAAGFTWPTTLIDICDSPTCIEPGFKTRQQFPQCCYGHYEYDQLLDFVNRDVNRYVGPTNHDIMVGMDPTSTAYSMPYIYDHFDWDHCEQDYGFEATINKMYEQKTGQSVARRMKERQQERKLQRKKMTRHRRR